MPADAGKFKPARDAGRDPQRRREDSLLVPFARAMLGLGMPSPGQMARLGVPVGGRVRKLRAVGDKTDHPPVRRKRVRLEGGGEATILLARRAPTTRRWSSRRTVEDRSAPIPER